MTTHAMDSTVSRPSSGIASPPRHMRSRTQSISSDRPSTIGHSLMSPPLSVAPEAAFIAASAASQIVTNDHDSHADQWYDQHGIEPAGETALVSPAALQLVNNFIDQLLFNFLSVARTTTLAALRPAVSEVLKPKLAKDAINQADEELREYLGGGDEDDFVQPHGSDGGRDWDLELVWKRTRLRCMVYSSLGDMEEEDEDYYMEQENLEPGADDSLNEVISPAVAIFLTSILEFMGEQALVVAGQAAYHRVRAKYEKELKEGARSPADIADRIVVEELDMERVALDRTLGRLWRAWKKRIRSPTTETGQRPFSRDSMRGFSHARTVSLSENPLPTRKPSVADPEMAVEDPQAEKADDDATEVGDAAAAEEVVEPPAEPADIPLPMGDRDIDEIEVPGLVYYSDEEDDEEDEEDEDELPVRPKSMMIMPHSLHTFGMPTPAASEPSSPVLGPRKRSNSLPNPSAAPAKRPKIEELETPAPEEEDASDDTVTLETAEDETSPATPAAESPVEAKQAETPRKSANRPANIITAAATAAATVTAAKAVRGQSEEEVEADLDDYEPEILTSSRVSISGRSSSPAISDSGKPIAVVATRPQRSPSVHSARIIEVTGPKSPRSRNSSVDTSEHQKPVSLSRASSVSTPTIPEQLSQPQPQRRPQPAELEAIKRTGSSSPNLRSPAVTRPTRQGANQSISEVEEDADALSGREGSTPTTASLSTPTSATVPPEELQSQIKQSHAIFGSVMRHHEPTSPRSPKSPTSPRQEVPRSPAGTKVTILSTTNSNGPYVEDMSRSRTTTVTIPERSSARLSGAQSPAQSIGVVSIERASGRRGSADPRDEYGSPIAPRQIHTSGSTGSSGTSSRLKPVRTSEESGSKASVARNFEELIQSDQTIQYTLTPESMRDIEVTQSANNTSPVVSTKNRKSEDARGMNGGSRMSSSTVDLKRTPSITVATGLNSHPIPKDVPATSKLSGPVPRMPAGARNRTNAPQARDARVPRESVMDFADFIRSTGPTGDNSPAPLRNLSGPVPSSRMVVDGRRVSSVARPKLQARDASTDAREDSSDLIDFIRRGPPNGASNPRIPRTVAPFRTTMDSDQMSGAVGGRAVDATVPSIRYSQASTTNMTESSFSSNTALIRNRPSPQNSSNMFDEEDMMPKRKTRRVRDPYAIDFSDEEDEDLGVPARPPPKEESLADFLKNYNPPGETAGPMSYDAPPVKAPKKKASAPSLMGRFSRGQSSNVQRDSTDSRPMSSRTGNGRGYIPIQVNMPPGYDKYGPIDTSASRPPMPSSVTTGRVPMKKFEPRDPVSSSSRTSELADFFRNSEPPMGQAGASRGPYSPPIEEESNMPKVFGRRKKSAYA